MSTLEVFTKFNPMETDSWQVDWFDEDCEGNKIQPCIGVRVNDGTWVPAIDLLTFIEERMTDLAHVDD